MITYKYALQKKSNWIPSYDLQKFKDPYNQKSITCD